MVTNWKNWFDVTNAGMGVVFGLTLGRGGIGA
jgi:hypothetical protein